MSVSICSAFYLRESIEVCWNVVEVWLSSVEYNSFCRSPAAWESRNMTICTNCYCDGNPKCDERSLRHPRRALCRIGETLRRFLSGALETYGIWHRLRADQRALLEMDGRMLRDIGITRYDALREARQSLQIGRAHV